MTLVLAYTPHILRTNTLPLVSSVMAIHPALPNTHRMYEYLSLPTQFRTAPAIPSRLHKIISESIIDTTSSYIVYNSSHT